MKNIVIIGGKLQGVEAVYLSKKAGYKVTLIDKKEGVPAQNMADEFIHMDLRKIDEVTLKKLIVADLVLPANENMETLECLHNLAKKVKMKLAFDIEAYRISSSKLLSDKLFANNNIDAPKYYPEGEAPYIIKPSDASGSKDVRLIESTEEVEEILQNSPEGKWIVQEYITGPSYSVEVIGRKGSYRTYETTEIHMDEVYDCNKVTIDREKHKDFAKELSEIAIKIASLININGIVDLEVIEHKGTLKSLEIDARMPSQTPIAVYHGTGVNYIEELVDLVAGKFKMHDSRIVKGEKKEARFVAFEPLKVEDGEIREEGEHIMSGCGPLQLVADLWGADEVITNYTKGSKRWVANVITSADSKEELEEKRRIIRKRIRDELMQ